MDWKDHFKKPTQPEKPLGGIVYMNQWIPLRAGEREALEEKKKDNPETPISDLLLEMRKESDGDHATLI